ncbi:MAG: threonine/serine dehydratase [Planctomycetota bacterium]
MSALPDLDLVREAAARIRGRVLRTPVQISRVLNEEFDCELFFKCENLQEIGAFKARGATNAVFALDDETANRGVVTHSSGNHGAALAFAAEQRGIPCAVVVPKNAPEVKLRNIQRFGAEIVFCEPSERASTCARVAEERGASIVHPFENPNVMAGQATAALELCEDIEGLDTFVAPVGGGGLLSGTTVVAKSLLPNSQVIGAEPLAVDDAARSMATGVRQPRVENPVTACDGLMTNLGEPNFEILQRHQVEVLTADEPAIQRAGIDLCRALRVVVEPSAAVALAVMRGDPERFAGRRVGVILTGGNTDFSFLCAAVREVFNACPGDTTAS